MIENGVSERLHNAIRQFMALPQLKDFHLGGGTNLAIKYNHRESIDIDLFSQNVLGKDKMNEIHGQIQETFEDVIIQKNNASTNYLYFLEATLPKEKIKVQIIQNLKNISQPETIRGLQLIHDDDIGALKLLSAAGRGVQKDFYDLYLLTEIKPLSHYYDHLLSYYEKNRNAPPNIFDNIGAMGVLPSFDLSKDLSPLCDFNHAGDKKNPSNRVVFTDNSPIDIPWPVLRDKWKAKVIQLAKERGLRFQETPTRRKPKFPGSWAK